MITNCLLDCKNAYLLTFWIVQKKIEYRSWNKLKIKKIVLLVRKRKGQKTSISSELFFDFAVSIREKKDWNHYWNAINLNNPVHNFIKNAMRSDRWLNKLV